MHHRNSHSSTLHPQQTCNKIQNRQKQPRQDLRRRNHNGSSKHKKTQVTSNNQIKSQSALALPINTWEIVALASSSPNPARKAKRAATCAVGFADFVIVAVGLYAVFEVALSDYALGNAPVGYERPWKGMQDLAVILVAVVV